MSVDNCSVDPDINLDNFRRCGWKDALATVGHGGYFEIFKALNAVAQQMNKDTRIPESKILKLLADACSMFLQSDKYNEPFKPRLMRNGKQTTIPDDYSPENIDFFAKIVEEVDNIWLQARLADLIWFMKKPRELRFALMAIDAYMKIPIQLQTWLHGGDACWERALWLAILLGRGAESRVEEIENLIIAAIEKSEITDGFLAYHLTELLVKTHLNRKPKIEVVQKLEALANSFKSANEFNKSNAYFDAAAKWYGYLKKEDKVVEMIISLSENFVKIASIHMSGKDPSNAAGAMFLEKAIHAYRRIPSIMRPANKVDERITELHKMMTDASGKSLKEMKQISSTVDITDLVEKVRETMSGKSLENALLEFSNIYSGISLDKLRHSSIKYLQQNPLLALISATSLSPDGRVVAKKPGMIIGSKEEDNKVSIWAEMIKDYTMQIGIVVQGNIWPALDVLILEHRITEFDLINIAYVSPVVPPDREIYIGRGLFFGFERDFITAIHILIPQIEHIIRWHLKHNGVKTTTLDDQGIENESSLNTLLEKPQVKEIFGEDFSFELQAILTDPFGPNLRNLVAHGLLEFQGANSIFMIYTWWLLFKLVYINYINTLSKQRSCNVEKKDDVVNKET